MKIERKKTRGDMTPMIDCVFLLLIFFIISAKFITPEGYKEVWMPKDSGLKGPTNVDLREDTRIVLRGGKDKNITLFLDKIGIATFNKDLRQWKLSRQNEKFDKEMKLIHTAFTGKEGLEEQLRQLKRRGAIKKIVIDAGPEVPYLFVMQALEACQNAQITDLKFTGSQNRLKDQHQGLIMTP